MTKILSGYSKNCKNIKKAGLTASKEALQLQRLITFGEYSPESLAENREA